MPCRAKANSIANSSTCRMLPSTKAPTTVLGMMSRMKPDGALVVRLGDVFGDGGAVDLGGIDVHAFAGADRRWTTMRPMMSAIVVRISK